MVLASLGKAIRDVVLPRGCAGCDMPDEVLCPQCRRRLHGAHEKPIGLGEGAGCYCCAWYEGCIRHAILAWKDHGDEECDGVFADALTALARDVLAGIRCGVCGGSAASGQSEICDARDGGELLIVPAPSSTKSMRRRGRNHLLPVARRMASQLSHEGIIARASTDLNIRGVTGKSVQTGGAADRSQRIEGHVLLTGRARCRGRRVLVIDDIVTTGATMRQCARVLHDGGAHVVACLALAGVRPRDGR